MKQLTCEMCGSTDLMKQDGVFVCQTCGCKYSLEEAKKMMAEVTGTVQVSNSAQLENLINLAKSSIESKNFSKAEDFCNQVLAMDDQNYEAWRLKAEAVNGQIGSNNPRIEEVFNCIMTAYDVSSDEEKKERSSELIAWLLVTFQSEISFWLQQIETNRPTKGTVTTARNSFVDSWNKMKIAAEKMGFDEKLSQVFLNNLDNHFCSKANSLCVSAWKTTVGYNYYRDYMGSGKDPFGRSDQRWVLSNTDLYRPTKHIWDTFLEETDLLIELLQFAEQQFNESTDEQVKENIYSNIAYFESCVIPSGSWKITQGYTSNWDQYKTVGWHEEYSLTDSAKSARRTIQSKYERLEEQAKKDGERKKKEEEEKKIAKYWEEHADEKKALDEEKATLQNEVSALTSRKNAISYSKEISLIDERIKSLEAQKSSLGIFKGKEKKALQEQIDAANAEKKSIQDKEAKEKAAVQTEIDPKQNRINAIDKELTKAR